MHFFGGGLCEEEHAAHERARSLHERRLVLEPRGERRRALVRQCLASGERRPSDASARVRVRREFGRRAGPREQPREKVERAVRDFDCARAGFGSSVGVGARTHARADCSLIFSGGGEQRAGQAHGAFHVDRGRALERQVVEQAAHCTGQRVKLLLVRAFLRSPCVQFLLGCTSTV